MAEIKLYANQSAMIDYVDESYNDHASQVFSGAHRGIMSFSSATAVSPYNKIVSVALWLYFQQIYKYRDAYVSILSSSFDEKTVTYGTKPGSSFSEKITLPSSMTDDYREVGTIATAPDDVQRVIEYGLIFECNSTVYYHSSRSDNKPYLAVNVSDELATGTMQNFTPAAGAIIDLSKPIIFTFSFTQNTDEPSLEALKIVSFTLQLRVHGQSAITSIPVTTWAGDAPNVTVPAGTISGESIDWRVISKTNANQTLTSDWMTLSVEDVPPVARPISPKDVVVNGSVDQPFVWMHATSTGTAQTKAELQASTDGNTWTALATVTGSEQQWTCPAGTLTENTKFWRVRTYSSANAVSDWSDAAQIVVIAAPTAPSIQIKSTGPRPSISWQTSEQEAYQVELDGKLSGGTHYGTEKTWTSPAYLSDGSHTVRVRVQNQYGMWSDWGAAALPVTNTPGAAITLSVQASSVADLSWQTTGSYDFYLVYRNGKPIAKLTQTQYTDELSSGSTTYQVRGCYADSSNYGLSSAVTATITTGQYVTLYGIASGKKVTLKHCGLKNQPVQNAINRDIQYIFMYGSTYPHAERSEFVTKKVGGTAVFLPDEDKAGFDALIGELVCLKTQSGEMVVGYLNETSDTSRVNPDKSVVNFSIQQIDYAEVIDIDS